MARLALYLLGQFNVTLDEEPVTRFRSDKERALLAYLAVEDARPHRREALVDLLWPELPEQKARNNLRVTLHRLRSILGELEAETPFLKVNRGTVQLNPAADIWLDVASFTETMAEIEGHEHPSLADCWTCMSRLSEVVEYYRGDFLQGFIPEDSLVFLEWAGVQREWLHVRVLDALHHLADHHRRRGEFELAQNYARRQLELEPWREEAHRQIMELLARLGERSAALAQYETCRRMLAEELGLEPSEETNDLYERIQAGKLDALPQRPAFLEMQVEDVAEKPLFVARTRQLARLHEFLHKTLTGQSQVAFVVGDAGRGKTSLMNAFADQVQETHSDLVVAMGNCNAFSGVGDPYLPFRDILEMLTGDLKAQWSAGTITREHARRLWSSFPLTVKSLIKHGTSLVDFIHPEALLSRAEMAALDEGSLKKLKGLIHREKAEQNNLEQAFLFEQYANVLRDLANHHPLLLIIDDLQWVDAASVGLLFHLGRRLEGKRIFICGAYRPEEVAMGRDDEQHPLEKVLNEFKRSFGDMQVNLGQLTEVEEQTFVDDYLNSQPNQFGEAFRKAFFRHTRGNALFTVEMLRGMQERGDIVRDADGQWVEGPTLNWQAIPEQLEGVIEGRIRRLPSALQDTLTVASVEGETFTVEVVAQVQAADESEMTLQLSRKLARQHQLIRFQGHQKANSHLLTQYHFGHILIQKHLYNGLDNAERAYLHKKVGYALEELYGHQGEKLAVQLAKHFLEAGMFEKAIHYLRRAGERAVQLSAHDEAIKHFNQVLALLAAFPETRERNQQELEVRLALGISLMASKGSAASEVGENYSQAQLLCQELEVTHELLHVLEGLYQFNLIRGELQEARKLAEQLLELAQRHQSTLVIASAHTMLGAAFVYLGEFASALKQFEQGLTLYNIEQRLPLATLYRQDPLIANLTYMSITLWLLGYPDQAFEKSREAVDLAEELSHPYSLVHTLIFAALFHLSCGRIQAALSLVEEVISLSAKWSYSFWLASATFFRGWLLVLEGQKEIGVAQMSQGIAARGDSEAKASQTQYLFSMADVFGRVGRFEEGLALINEALDTVERTGERYWEAELHRLKGDMLLAWSDNIDIKEAETQFKQAIVVAHSQGAKSWELRASISLSRLWLGQGKSQRAKEMLAEIYGWFTEGYDTADLREAKEILDKLGE